MKKALSAWLVALFALYTPGSAIAENSTATNRPVRDKWALIVGIGKFQSPSIPKLNYAAKDARDFREFLIKEANFAPDHVRILVDEAATQRRVLSELGNKFLARVAKPDDVVVLFFSSHGSPAQADLRGKNFVVAYDSDPEDLFTTGIEMDKILESIQSRVLSERVLLVLDACHSGAVVANAKGLARPANFDAEALAQGSGQMVICSSAPDQQSWESKRYANGIFTRKLLEALRIKGRQTTLGDALPYVQQSVSAEVQEDYGSRQTPSLRSKWDGNDLVLAAVPVAPQPLPVAVRQMLQPDSSQIAAPLQVQRPSPTVTPSTTAPLTTANSGDWRRAIAMYRRGDYASSVEILQSATAGPAAKDADAHLHLANALIKLGRYDTAAKEYKESFRLNPNGKQGDYCLQMINYCSRGSQRTGPVGTTTVARGSSTAAPIGATIMSVPSVIPTAGIPQRNASPAQASSAIPESVIAQVRTQLPRINRPPRERPYHTDILNQWTVQERANYYPEAINRSESARNKLEEATRTLARAKQLCGPLLPANRGYGETEDAYRQRLAAGQQIVDQLLAPYNAEVDTMTRRLQDEESLVQTCLTAYRQMFPGTVIAVPGTSSSGTSGGTTTTSTCGTTKK